jgi:hypothetical protein
VIGELEGLVQIRDCLEFHGNVSVSWFCPEISNLERQREKERDRERKRELDEKESGRERDKRKRKRE